jgi:uncharacterized protein (DUF433 family)
VKQMKIETFGHQSYTRDHLPKCRDHFWDYSVSRSPKYLLARLEAEPPDQDVSLSEAVKLAIDQCPSVSSAPEMMHGQPCLAGTRIPVSAILRVLEHYGSLDDVVKCYPQLTKDQAKDALYFSQLVLEPVSGEDDFTHTAR